MRRLLLAPSFFAPWLALVAPVAGTAQSAPPGAEGSARVESPSIADEIKWRVERLRTEGSLLVAGRRITRRDLTLAVYEHRDFQPLWTDPIASAGLVRAILSADRHGLSPEHYHLSVLSPGGTEAVLSAPSMLVGGSVARAAELELLRTDAFVRLGQHLRFGKVTPEGPAPAAGTPWRFGGAFAVDSLVATVSERRVEQGLDDLAPSHFVYHGLLEALSSLRRVAGRGGWEPVPEGPTMRPDSLDTRVPALRRRLGVPGEDSGPTQDTLRFDAALEAAVKVFQHAHGLNEDGLVGPSTRAALNVPVERRIEQVRVNLERARWVAHELPDTLVAVNVAGARAYVLHGDSVAFETRAIVGTDYTRTPLFSAPMLYVDLNPTWTVPSSIADEVLDALRRNPAYLQEQGMRVLDGAGREVDPAGIDFARYTGRTFPYVFRQDPGPANALGEIKLMFPNAHSVYLHDTPSRGLFAREERLFSHGCIRIEDPIGLAALVLGDPERWNRETLRDAIDTGETRTIGLARPIPVFVLYWTAAVDLHGELHFYRDVYRRDAAILEALDRDDGS